MHALAEDIMRLKQGGAQVVLVSSGAVALGRYALGLKKTDKLEEKQAAAAAGQSRLMHAYETVFATYNTPVAQALLTPDDTERRRRWLNARATFDALLRLGAVPIVNENDTVATEELRYGDNDRLAARVAQMIGADVLILLSDVDGLYEHDPREDPNAAHIPEVRAITRRDRGDGRGASIPARPSALAGCARKSRRRKSPPAPAAPSRSSKANKTTR